MSPGKNIEFFRQIPKRLVDALENLGPGALGCVASPLVETTEFGTNPGNLRMLSFVPEILQPSCALVVVLHGSAVSIGVRAGRFSPITMVSRC